MHTDRSGSRKEIVTTNPLYRCEEFERDNVSVYDEIEENKYYDLKEHEIYLDVVANEGEECDQGDKPEFPRSRENIYLDVLSDERRSRGSRSPSPGASAGSDHGSRPATSRLHLDVLSDKRSMQGSRPPSPRPSARSDHSSRPATPRLDTTYQDRDQGSDYEGLRTEEHDHTYTDMNSESEERDGDSEDQRQEANTVFKKGKTDLVSNYRPISLLSIFDKLLEKNSIH